MVARHRLEVRGDRRAKRHPRQDVSLEVDTIGDLDQFDAVIDQAKDRTLRHVDNGAAVTRGVVGGETDFGHLIDKEMRRNNGIERRDRSHLIGIRSSKLAKIRSASVDKTGLGLGMLSNSRRNFDRVDLG